MDIRTIGCDDDGLRAPLTKRRPGLVDFLQRTASIATAAGVLLGLALAYAVVSGGLPSDRSAFIPLLSKFMSWVAPACLAGYGAVIYSESRGDDGKANAGVLLTVVGLVLTALSLRQILM